MSRTYRSDEYRVNRKTRRPEPRIRAERNAIEDGLVEYAGMSDGDVHSRKASEDEVQANA